MFYFHKFQIVEIKFNRQNSMNLYRIHLFFGNAEFQHSDYYESDNYAILKAKAIAAQFICPVVSWWYIEGNRVIYTNDIEKCGDELLAGIKEEYERRNIIQV